MSIMAGESVDFKPVTRISSSYSRAVANFVYKTRKGIAIRQLELFQIKIN